VEPVAGIRVDFVDADLDARMRGVVREILVEPRDLGGLFRDDVRRCRGLTVEELVHRGERFLAGEHRDVIVVTDVRILHGCAVRSGHRYLLRIAGSDGHEVPFGRQVHLRHGLREAASGRLRVVLDLLRVGRVRRQIGRGHGRPVGMADQIDGVEPGIAAEGVHRGVEPALHGVDVALHSAAEGEERRVVVERADRGAAISVRRESLRLELEIVSSAHDAVDEENRSLAGVAALGSPAVTGAAGVFD
jgi:hypothetical protein